MSALDDLQRSLSRAVDAGAAADPTAHRSGGPAVTEGAAVRGADGTAPIAAVSERRRFAGLRRRRGWHVFLGILVAGGVTTGALAATGTLRIVKDPGPEYAILGMLDDDLVKPIDAPRLLPVRIADTDGGPPWALRTFQTRRQAACLQVGQVYEGNFGVVQRRPGGEEVFQVLPVNAGVYGTACGRAREGGFPLVGGRRQAQLLGPQMDRAACNGQATGRNACPVEAIRVIRFGALGPAARSATFIHRDGRRGTTQELTAETGGAYLFVESVDPRPTQAAAAAEAALQAKVDARFPRVPYGSIPKSERPAADRRWQARIRYLRKLYAQSRVGRRRAERDQIADEGVVATFVGAGERKVAGRGQTRGPIPGVEPIGTSQPTSP